MASTSFDVQIGSTKAKILRTEEGGYRRRTIRREVEQQLLSQAEAPAMVSRADQRQLYQTSWAGGSRWWKPLLGPQEADSYFQSNHMDTWSEPGKVVPGNQVNDAANTDLHDNCVMATDDSGDVYAIGSTSDTNASFLDVYKWTPASDAFVRETGFHSGVPAANDPTGMVFDPNDGYFYIIDPDDDQIHRFKPGTGQDNDWLGIAIGNDSQLFLHRQGLVIYRGDIRLIDKSGTPSSSTKFDDGLSTDLLQDVDISGTEPLIRSISNGQNTPEGIYYAKNVLHRGSVVPWVFRVDRDEAGNWLGVPIATLPVGSIVIGVTYHLGSILVLASPDWRTILDNDTQEAEMQLLSVSSQGINVLGSFLGGRDELDETPHSFLGSSGSLVYIGGQKRLWVYDGARGGLHTAFEFGTELSDGGYVQMASVTDSSDDQALIFLGKDRIARMKLTQTDDPDTVASFGDDETHYVLTSNYFDGGLPFEDKELTRVEIMHEAIDGSSNQEWTVQISADDGSFSDALVNSTADSTYASADLTGTTGRRFQYRLIYQTKNTLRKALRALKVAFTTGEMITEWDLTLDGDELLNVDNEVQDEQAFYDSLVTLAGTSTITTLVDNMQEQAQLTDTGTTTNVRVQAVEISKTKPGESMIRVVLREAA